MATRKNIEEILSTLAALWPKQGASISTKLGIDMYWMALKDVPDKKLAFALSQYLEKGEYFPKPADLRALISELDVQKHAQELKDRFTCTKCGSQVSLIMGQGERGLCLDCSRGVIYEKNDIKRAIYPDQESVMIQDRTMCNSCKKVFTCYRDSIQESWKCVDCYSGLTGKQRVQRFKDLFTIMEDKQFVPEWDKELVEKYPEDMPLTIKRINQGLPEQDEIPF